MRPLVVYDTMLFFQALAHELPRLHGTFQAIESSSVRLCMSQELYDEIADVLTRQEMRQKAPSLTPDRVAQFLAKVKCVSHWFDEVPNAFTLPSHPDDDHLFNLLLPHRPTIWSQGKNVSYVWAPLNHLRRADFVHWLDN